MSEANERRSNPVISASDSGLPRVRKIPSACNLFQILGVVEAFFLDARNDKLLRLLQNPIALWKLDRPRTRCPEPTLVPDKMSVRSLYFPLLENWMGVQ